MRTTTTLLDEVLPVYDVRSRYVRRIAAPAERVADVVERVPLSPGARLLFALRGLGVPHGSLREILESSGLAILAERPGVEVVAGTTGRFWAVREQANLEAPRDLEAFRAFRRPGWAVGTIALRIEPGGAGWSEVTMETRVRCVDDVARRRFAVYWLLIRTFSGWLRRDFLRRLARMAEERG